MNDVSKSIRWVSKEISYRADNDKFFAELQRIWPPSFIHMTNVLHTMLSEGEARLSTTWDANESNESVMHSLIFDTGIMSTQEAVDLIIFMSPGASEIVRASDHHICFNYDTYRSDNERYPLISIYEYLDDEPYVPST